MIVVRSVSTLDEEDDRPSDDVCRVESEVLTTVSAASTLLELDDSERLDVRLVEIEAFT